MKAARQRAGRAAARHENRPAVVIVVGPYPPPVHGAARVTQLVTDNLRDAGAMIRAVDTSGVTQRSRAVYHLSRIWSHVRAARVVAGAGRDVTAVYFAGAGGLGLWYQLVVVLIARAKGYQLVFHHHSYAAARHRMLAMDAIARAGGRRLLHIALCERMAESLSGNYPAISRVRVCSNAGLFDPVPSGDGASHEPQPSDRTVVLGHLSNLSAEKGLDLVLDTMRAVRAARIPARLLLAGPATTAEAAAMVAAAEREFGADVEHLGAVPPTDVESFYRKLDVFVFPSRYKHEAEPLVVLEASRCGVPTVAFDIGCLGALIPDHEWLVAPGNRFPQAATELVLRVAESANRSDVRASVQEHFTARRLRAVSAHRELVLHLLTPGPSA